MVRARLGLGPWEVLHQGISNRTGVPIGTVGIAVGALVLLGWLPLKQRLGIGTISNVVLIGLTIDGVLAVTDDPTNVAVRIGCLVAGITMFGVGSGLYIGAGLGAGPRDGLMTGIAGRPGTRHSLRTVRTAIELTALAGGWLLGGQRRRRHARLRLRHRSAGPALARTAHRTRAHRTRRMSVLAPRAGASAPARGAKSHQ